MSQAQTQSQAGSRMESPETPQQPDEPSLGNYDTNIVQLSDTETDGVPTEQILDNYEEGDVDAFIYAGDASKKTTDPASYLGQFEDTYQDLSKIQEELDTEVLVEPGNHAPIKGAHNAGGWAGAADDEDYVEQVEDILGEHYEEFKDADENAYEFLTNEYDLTNIEYDSVEVGDLTVVGGTHHDGELDIERKWLEEGPELEDLDYDPEEVSEDVEIEVPYDGFFSGLPLVGDFIGNLFSSTENPEPDEVSLEDIPEDYEKTGKHEEYEEALELLEYFEESIEAAENDVFLSHHSVVSSMDEQFGSDIADYVTDKYDLTAVGGGHTGTPQVDDSYGVPTINTNGGAVIEMGFNEGEMQYADAGVEPENSGRAAQEPSQEPSEEEILEGINQQMEAIDENGIEEVVPDPDEILSEDPDEQEVMMAAQLEQRRGMLENAYDQYQEQGEFESMTELEDAMPEEEQPRGPQVTPEADNGAATAQAGA